MTLHHISLGTNDRQRARAFYDPVLATIGMRLLGEDELAWHYGSSNVIFSLIVPIDGKPANVGNGTHVAFSAETRAMVDAFYNAALANGGTSDGPPGLRPEYDPNYYAAFARDPDGHRIEVVTFLSK